MRAAEVVYFIVGVLVGVGATFLAYRYLHENYIGQERLGAYRLFMQYYTDRETCLSLSKSVHRKNEQLLNVVKMVGPAGVAEWAEAHYLNCTSVRDDARNANVPADWYSRTGHSWTRFDRSRAQLVAQMVKGLPSDYRQNFQPEGGIEREEGAPATTRKR